MGAAEIPAVPAPGACGDALAGAHRLPRSRPVCPVAAGRAAGGWSVGAGWGESFTSGSGKAEGCKSPPLLDFVILSRGHAAEALTWTKAVMAKLGLTLNEAKTSLKDARRESFDFLGYTLGPRHFPNGGRWYLGASPSKKSVQRVKAKISDLLVPGNKGAWDEVRARLNRILRGWSAYFAYGALASAYEAVDRHVYDRARNFLRQRHKAHGRGVDRFSREHIYGELAVRCLRERGRSSPWALQ